MVSARATERAKKIRFVLTDCDGVLTDTGVYYSEHGEELKRFSIRDGMGVERLRTQAGIDVGIVTGEYSGPLQRRAEKLQIEELHLGVKDKAAMIKEFVQRRNLKLEQIAYIGDDTNDLAIMAMVGLRGCPADAVPFVLEHADYVCRSLGGYGAFREFAEFIIASQTQSGQLAEE
jgi:3-deoxy-D-manno-octulosonate 8-phosphate phosphatase (KDO 8-P phosphatase)